jgi:hypothetical protein
MVPSPDDVRPLITALAGLDEASFFAHCTAAGGAAGRGTVRRLFERAKKKGIEAFPLGALGGIGGRAALICTLHQRSPKRALGRLWLHLLAQEGIWKAEGYSEHEEQTTLFLAGVLPAIFDSKALPSSAAAQSWGESVMSLIDGPQDALAEWVTADGAEALRGLPGGQAGAWHLLPTHHVASIGRHLVGFMFESQETLSMEKLWFVLETTEGKEPAVIGQDYVGGTKLLLQDHREVTAP